MTLPETESMKITQHWSILQCSKAGLESEQLPGNTQLLLCARQGLAYGGEQLGKDHSFWWTVDASCSVQFHGEIGSWLWTGEDEVLLEEAIFWPEHKRRLAIWRLYLHRYRKIFLKDGRQCQFRVYSFSRVGHRFILHNSEKVYFLCFFFFLLETQKAEWQKVWKRPQCRSFLQCYRDWARTKVVHTAKECTIQVNLTSLALEIPATKVKLPIRNPLQSSVGTPSYIQTWVKRCRIKGAANFTATPCAYWHLGLPPDSGNYLENLKVHQSKHTRFPQSF